MQIFFPKLYYKNIQSIELQTLKENNIKGLILDVDNTLIDLDWNMPKGVEEWIQKVKNENIKIYIVSNTNKKDKIEEISQKLGVPYTFFAKKPFRAGFLKACKEMGLPCKNVATIGDQIFTDVYGSNRCNIFSILVEPIKRKDYIITKIKRPLENWVIRKYLKSK